MLLAKQFCKLIYIHTPRSQNILADALASLASSLSFPLSRSAETIIVQRLEAPFIQDPWFDNLRNSLVVKAERREAKKAMLMELGEMMEEERPWYHEIEQYCKDGSLHLSTDALRNRKLELCPGLTVCICRQGLKELNGQSNIGVRRMGELDVNIHNLVSRCQQRQENQATGACLLKNVGYNLCCITVFKILQDS
ncbi:hypothetical protein Taro_054325 [Colocasia esculenta]|uniref:RNase H type-1 domain-containing protein n=1 Tax=Colocasia esculenta TaxID=4460 RepID=A0A843XQV3_COLES|nr:hypothetical protein [Colocasia esculenta]